MSWIRRRPLTALAALALALRVACVALTEFYPLFPAYYYTDATLTHAGAARALEEVRAGLPPTINGALSERIQTSISLGVYRAFGPRPILIKLINASLGSLAVAAFSWALCMVFPAPPALAAGLILAVWPSHVFYTAQNLKEAPVAFLAYLGLGAAFASGLDAGASRRRSASFALGAGLALLGAGFYRPHVLVCLTAALLIAVALASAKPPRANGMLAAALLGTLALFPILSRELHASFDSQALDAADRRPIEPSLIPVTYDPADARTVSRPTSPVGISLFRKTRQAADRRWAANASNREIGTQIYPDEEFRSWADVLLYLPKGAFTVLFMPLPGLYPLDGRAGRWAAAGENAALVVLALFAAAGFVRGRMSPARIGLLAFFAMMTAGAALLEFDLGSAGRHKLLYLPMLFPFAAEEALRLAGRRRTE